jgi:hypothetical protein
VAHFGNHWWKKRKGKKRERVDGVGEKKSVKVMNDVGKANSYEM